MPAPHPPEFRQRAVDLARSKVKTVAEIAKDLSIAESCLRNWLAQADADEGRTHPTPLISAGAGGGDTLRQSSAIGR